MAEANNSFTKNKLIANNAESNAILFKTTHSRI